jgi:imidazolonepropionase-like amidohydrolase
MCLHDHDAATTPRPSVSRRGVLATAAALAGVPTVLDAATKGASAAGGALRRGTSGAPATGELVVEGGTLLDPATGAVTEDSVVVIRDGKVVAAGSRDATRRARVGVGAGATIVDATGEWVLPGLVDVHAHLNALGDAAAILQRGTTSVRSGTSTFYQDVAMRTLTQWAPGRVPRMRAAGVFVTPELGDTVLADPDLAPLAALPQGVVEPEDLAYLTRVNVSRGVDVVKTRANPRAGLADQDPRELVYDEEQLRAVVRAAGPRGVLCHAYSAEGIHGAVAAGIASLEHGVFVREDTIALMVRKGTYFTPTMEAIETMADSPNPVLAARGREYAPVLREAVRAAYEAGVPVVAGTDTFGTDGPPVGDEALRLHRAGLPALEAVRACTTRAAALLGWADTVGRLARGYAGDLVTLAGSPLDDPAHLVSPRLVVAQGVVVRDAA